MTDSLFSPIEIQSIQSKIDLWLENRINEDAVIKSADYDANESRWYVRVTGEEKAALYDSSYSPAAYSAL